MKRLKRWLERKWYRLQVRLGLANPERDLWSSFHTCREGFGPPDPPYQPPTTGSWPPLDERDLELMQPNPKLLLTQAKLYPYPR